MWEVTSLFGTLGWEIFGLKMHLRAQRFHQSPWDVVVEEVEEVFPAQT